MRLIPYVIVLLFVCASAFAMTPGIDRHSQGDVIAVRTDDQIAQWCNFDKQIVVTANVLCIYNGKGSRKADF